MRRAFTWIELLVVISIIGMLVGLLWPSSQPRDSKLWHRCESRCRKITAALYQYHEKYDSFPPAYVVDAEGKPLYSWRVLILPFQPLERGDLYSKFHLDEPWDSPHNRTLLAQCPEIFQCPFQYPKGSTEGFCSYAMIVGPNTISTGPGAVSKGDITDDMEKTILFTETTAAIPWTAPIDIPFDSLAKGIVPSSDKSIGIGTAHPKGYVQVMYAGFRQTSLPPDTPPDRLKALATISGGEKTDDD